MEFRDFLECFLFVPSIRGVFIDYSLNLVKSSFVAIQNCVGELRRTLLDRKLAVEVTKSVYLPRALQLFTTSQEEFLRHFLNLPQQTVHNLVYALLL